MTSSPARAFCAIVAAVARNGVIGDGPRLPWRLPSDMRRFRRLTLGKSIVMGRRTFESIGKPLDGRLNIVVSRGHPALPEGVRLAASIDEAFEIARSANLNGEIMIIGGGEIYRQAIDGVDALYITHVEVDPPGDVFFPTIDPSLWRVVERERGEPGEKDSADSEFVVYQRAAFTRI